MHPILSTLHEESHVLLHYIKKMGVALFETEVEGVQEVFQIIDLIDKKVAPQVEGVKK